MGCQGVEVGLLWLRFGLRFSGPLTGNPKSREAELTEVFQGVRIMACELFACFADVRAWGNDDARG